MSAKGKTLSITVHPAPLHGEYMTVADAMRQVLDFIEALEKTETLDGGDAQIVWRLTKAHTNSPPLTVVAEAFSKNPTVSISMEAGRVSGMFASTLLSLSTGQEPEWFDVSLGKTLRRAFERNTNGIGLTEVQIGDEPAINIAPQEARLGLVVMDRIELDEAAGHEDWRRTEYGSFEGQIHSILQWSGRPAVVLIDRLSGQKVTCLLQKDVADRMGPQHSWQEAWEGHRLVVTGALHYSAESVLKRADVFDIDVVPWTDVKLTDLTGVNLLEGRSVRNHLDRLRGEDDA